MQIFDLHADIGFDVMQKNEQQEYGVINKYHVNNFVKGEIQAACMACCFEGKETWEDMQLMITRLIYDIQSCPQVDLVIDKETLLKENNHIKAMLSVEGMCGIHDQAAARIQWLYENGVRMASLCWNDANFLANGTLGKSQKGVSLLGEEVIQAMIARRMVIDVSHANMPTFWDIIQHEDALICASHSNVRNLCHHPRNLYREQLLALKERKALVGVVSAPSFISGVTCKQDIPHLIDHIAYLCDVMGVDYVALGFDFMNYYPGYENVHTQGLQNASKAQNLVQAMHKRGFHELEIEKIAYLNAMRFMEQAL